MTEKNNETKEATGVTLASVNEYLGIDFSDAASDRRIESLIVVADAWMEGAVGKNYNREDPRAVELSLMVIADLYESRTLSQKKDAVYKKLAFDFEQQMRLELRKHE